MLTPIAILANRYQSLFGGAITCDTIHAAFRIPVAGGEQHSINHGLAKYQLVVIDEASVVSTNSFSYITGTLNKLVLRPVDLAGDERQQQPLRIAGGRTRQAQSMLKYEHYQQLNNKYRLTSSSDVSTLHTSPSSTMCGTGFPYKQWSMRSAYYAIPIPQDFVKPYGKGEKPVVAGEILADAKPISCEWFRRPSVAISEIAESRRSFGCTLKSRDPVPYYKHFPKI